MNRLNGEFKLAMQEFHALWPIFEADGDSYLPDTGLSRREVIEKLWERGGLYRPACAFRHKEFGQSIPLDWPHTISAIYRVRCTLFHGHKGLHCENDVEIVSKAHRALTHILQIVIP